MKTSILLVLAFFFFNSGHCQKLQLDEKDEEVNSIMPDVENTSYFGENYQQFLIPKKQFLRNGDEEAILELIEEETASYYDINYERWQKNYVKSTDNVWLISSKGNYDTYFDWASYDEQFKSAFEEEKRVNREFKSPVKLKVYEDSAWILFNNEVFDEEGNTLETQLVTYFLEKKDDRWKIIYSNRIYPSTYHDADWGLLNNISYAKHIGKSPQDIASFHAERSIKEQGENLNYESYLDQLMSAWSNASPTRALQILEQNDVQVVFMAKDIAINLERSGSIGGVTYDEYLLYIQTYWSYLGDEVGAIYDQVYAGDGIQVSVSKIPSQ